MDEQLIVDMTNIVWLPPNTKMFRLPMENDENPFDPPSEKPWFKTKTVQLSLMSSIGPTDRGKLFYVGTACGVMFISRWFGGE